MANKSTWTCPQCKSNTDRPNVIRSEETKRNGQYTVIRSNTCPNCRSLIDEYKFVDGREVGMRFNPNQPFSTVR